MKKVSILRVKMNAKNKNKIILYFSNNKKGLKCKKIRMHKVLIKIMNKIGKHCEQNKLVLVNFTGENFLILAPIRSLNYFHNTLT